MKTFLTTLLVSLLLVGCAPMLNNKQQSENLNVASQQSAQLMKTAVSTPGINVSHVGKGASVSIETLPSTNSVSFTTEGEQSLEQSFWSKNKLPLSIALCIGAIGIFGLIWAIRAARASSRTVDSLYSAADSGFASLIHRMESHAATETDPSKLALVNSLLAEANKQRGKVSNG